jgi:hypothetical protein
MNKFAWFALCYLALAALLFGVVEYAMSEWPRVIVVSGVCEVVQ